MDSLKAKRVQLYLASFFLDMVGHAFPVLVSFHAERAFQARPRQIGYLGVVWMVVYSAVCLSTGGLSDRLGSRPLLLGSLFFMGIVLLPCLMLASSLAHLYVAMGLFGVALAFFWPPIQRQLALFSPGRLLWPALGAFNLSWSVGSVIGTVSGGPKVYEALGFQGVLLLLMSFIAFTSLSSLGLRDRPAARAESTPVDEVDDRRARLFLGLGWIANFCASFAMGGLHIIFADVTTKLRLTDLESTAILVSKEAGRLVAFALLRRFGAWHYSFAWLAFAQTVAGLALIAGGFVRSVPGLCALFGVLGLFSGLAYYSSILYSLNLRSEEGKKTGLHEGILAIGVVLGPFVLGETGELFPDWPGGAVCVTGIVLLSGVIVSGIFYSARRIPGARRVPSCTP